MIRTHGLIGADVKRIDAEKKVRGQAQYGADFQPKNVLHAALATSSIARGKIRKIDELPARAMPGVQEILTYKNSANEIRPGRQFLKMGHMATRIAPLGSPKIYFAGQIVAMVIADTFEQARDAALCLQSSIDYVVETPTAQMHSPGATLVKPGAILKPHLEKGDAARTFVESPAKVDRIYETSANHHNPMELFQATCEWDDDQLTVWESTQNVRGTRHGLAHQLRIKANQVRVLSHFIGGAFGSRGELGQATAIVALAAKKTRRPVKLVTTRQQAFFVRTFRAETKHHVKLSADAEGRLQSLSHEGWELTSRTDKFAVAGSDDGARLYQCPNIWTQTHNVETDRPSPAFMRAPPEVPYLFALESAMDELSYQLGIDPIELRRRNDTQYEPIDNFPFTSRPLLPCFDAAAKEFGWHHRSPQPRSTRDQDWLVGYGCATAFYHAAIAPASCRLILSPAGKIRVEIGTHDIGTGTYTIVAQTVADQMGLRIQDVDVAIGESDFPASPLSAGSNTTASVCHVLVKACDSMKRKLAGHQLGLFRRYHEPDWNFDQGRLQGPHGHSTPLSEAVLKIGGGSSIVINETHTPAGMPRLIAPFAISKGLPMMKAGVTNQQARFSFGAHLIEVRVHSITGEIRVPRMVGAFASGRIMNPRTAQNQLTGSQIWGLSSALHEITEIDERSARPMNNNFGDYHIPVNADIGDVRTLILPEKDEKVNPLGIKSIGELANTGINAAIANAVYHATGVRVRKLPIRIEDLLGGLDAVDGQR